VDVAIPDDNEMEVEIIEVQMDEVMMDIDEEDPLQPEEVVQGDIEFVDLLPADAEAVFEFRDIFDVLLPDVDEEVSKYLIHHKEYWLHFFFFYNRHFNYSLCRFHQMFPERMCP
jgi:hypothetical protein